MFGWLTRKHQPVGKPRPTADSRVVYLVGPGQLHWENNRFVYMAREKTTAAIVLQVESLNQLTLLGQVQMSAASVHQLLDRGINVSFLSASGHRYIGELTPPISSKPLHRYRQYLLVSDRLACHHVARVLIRGKIESQLAAARHYQRHGQAQVNPIMAQLKEVADQLNEETSIERLRGFEGQASALWFKAIGTLLRPPFSFKQRSRRPARDPVNALLNLGYMLLLARIKARLGQAGFDPLLGFLHRLRPGRPSLACDLMEPFRARAVDRWAIQILNEGRLKPDDFHDRANEGFRLAPDAFANVLASWERYWHEQRVGDLVDEEIRRLANTCSDLHRQNPQWKTLAGRGIGWGPTEEYEDEDLQALDHDPLADPDAPPQDS